MLKAVLFDMDGTLLDSEPLHAEATCLMLEKLGIQADHAGIQNKCIGADYESIWRDLRQQYDIKLTIPELFQMQLECGKQYFQEISLIETLGATNFIKELKNRNILTAVASSSPNALIKIILQKLKLEQYMEVYCGAETVVSHKPEPDIYLLTAERLGVVPEECLVFEDSSTGITAAKRAGMNCIALRNSYVIDETIRGADWYIDTFLDIDYDQAVRLMDKETL